MNCHDISYTNFFFLGLINCLVYFYLLSFLHSYYFSQTAHQNCLNSSPAGPRFLFFSAWQGSHVILVSTLFPMALICLTSCASGGSEMCWDFNSFNPYSTKPLHTSPWLVHINVLLQTNPRDPSLKSVMGFRRVLTNMLLRGEVYSCKSLLWSQTHKEQSPLPADWL